MQVKSIIGECLVKMGGVDFTQKSAYTTEEQALFDRLLAALNIAYREVCSQYLPQICEEEVVFSENEINVSVLAKRIIYPIALYKGGVKCGFKVYPDRIAADINGNAMLRYAYMPCVLSGESEISELMLTQSIMADGTLGEFYFQNKIFDLAGAFDTDFRSALSALRYKGRELSLKAGRWGA